MDIHGTKGLGDSWAFGPKRGSVTPTKRFSAVVLITVLGLVGGSLTALADELVYDGDTLTAGVQTTTDLGTVSPGATINHTIGLKLTCDTKKHADRGTTVTVSKGPASSVPTGGSLTMADVVFNVPMNWPIDASGSGTNCSSPPEELSTTQTVTIVAPTTPGTHTYELALTKSVSTGTPGDVKDPNPPKLTFTLTVQAPQNQPPTVSAGGPYSGNEGSEIALNGGSASDSDGTVASTTWSIVSQSGGGTCTLANPSSLTTATITCTDNGSVTVRLTATDNGGASAYSDATVTVNNVAPTATLEPIGSVNEGTSFSVSLTNASDVSPVDVAAGLRYAFSCTGADLTGTSYASAGTDASTSCTFDDGPDSKSVSAAIIDKDGGISTYTTSVSVNNVAPEATFSANTPINEGGSSTLSFTEPSDPSNADTAAGFRYAFSCTNGDLSSATYAGSGTAATDSCTFDDNGTFTVKGRIIDKDGGFTEYTTDVVVNNVAPTVSASITSSVDCGQNATLTFSFSDPGVNDGPWSVDIDWGDGSTDTAFNATSQGAQSDQTHTYVSPGSYTAVVSVTDKDNGTGSDDDNTVTVEQVYSVDFLPPFDDSSPSGLIVNKMKNGRVVPVKATIYDVCTESYLTDPSASVTIKVSKTSGTGTGDPIEEYADAGSSSAGTNAFRWSDDGFWIYNLDSKALGLVVNNTYRVDIYVAGVKATRDVWAALQPVK